MGAIDADVHCIGGSDGDMLENDRKEEEKMESINFLTWNVRGLHCPTKIRKIKNWCDRKGIDVAFLQETHLMPQEYEKLLKGWGKQIYHASYTKGSRGVCIIIGKRVVFEHIHTNADGLGRYVLIVGKLNGVKVALLNIYGPNFDSVDFVNELFAQAADWGGIPWVVGGDFNYVLDMVKDRSSSVLKPLPKCAQQTLEYMDMYNWVDMWRVLYPDKSGFTYYSTVHDMHSRIDRFLMSDTLLLQVKEVFLEPRTFSDHSPLHFEIEWGRNEKRRPRWRFRPDTLLDGAFEGSMRQHMMDFFADNKVGDTSALVRWAAFKCTMRGLMIGEGNGVLRTLRGNMQKLEGRLCELEERYAAGHEREVLGEICEVKKAYIENASVEIKHSGRITVAKRYLSIDKSGALLARMLNTDREAPHILSIEKRDGEKAVGTAEVLERFAEYYGTLYKARKRVDETEIDVFLREVNLPCIDPEARITLDGDITEHEIKVAIREMSCNKAPGEDGFGVDFYKHYLHELAPRLLEFYTGARKEGKWLRGMNEAIITILLKPGADRGKCEAYRPISLINADLKILAKVIANRILPFLDTLVGKAQNGFIPGRSTATNIRQLFTIIASLPHSSEAAIMSLDAAKAFDSIQWDFLFAVLAKFGFGETILNWIQMLYMAPYARVCVNGNMSDSIRIERGTRQGCPLSAMLFALVAEPLLWLLENSNEMSGIEVKGCRVVASMYADDLLLYMGRPATDMEAALQIFEIYGKVSGYTINWDKTVLFACGERADLTSFQGTEIKVVERFKYLGVQVARTMEEWYLYNVEPLLEYLGNRCESWKDLPLSLAGRIAVVKMVFLPKFLYVFNNVPVKISNGFFAKCRTKITEFIWQKKPPRIAFETLTRSYGSGGYALPDLYLYYVAAQAQHAVKWLTTCPREVHAGIEKRWFQEGDAGKLLCMPHIKVKQQVGPAEISLRLVRKQLGGNRFPGAYCASIPLWYLQDRICKFMQNDLRSWDERGLSEVQDLYEEGRLREEKDIVDQAGGGAGDIMKTKQLKHCMRRLWGDIQEEPASDSLLTHMLTTVGQGHQITKVYHLLRTSKEAKDLDVRRKWEREVDGSISDVEWYNACTLTQSVSQSMRLRLIHYKYLMRCYVTPEKLHNFNPQEDVRCKGCGEMNVGFLHVAWSCAAIHGFWEVVVARICEITGVRLENDPKTIFLNILPPADKLKKRWVNLALVVAKRMIARSWMQGVTPGVQRWEHDLVYCQEQEELMPLLMHFKQCPPDIWSDFRNYLFSKRATIVDEGGSSGGE